MNQSQACVERWKTALPEGRVLPAERLADYLDNCLGISRSIIAAIQPINEAEIITIVAIAREFQIPLYTISTGHNWGYGSSLPAADNCAILDLSRMNKILAMDAELGLITLEPGVTQQQLFDYFKQEKLGYYVPTTGAGGTASIVGNALERGFGVAPIEDHFQAITSLRAVLPDGTIYESPLAAMGAKQAGVWKWGVGPYLDGMFSQSNMGIVTSLQISLAKKPEHTELFVFTIKKNRAVEEFIPAVSSLLSDAIGDVGSIKLFNSDYQQLLPDTSTRNGLLQDAHWKGFGIFRSTNSMASGMRKEIARRLRPYCSRIIFTNERRLKLLRQCAGIIPGVTGQTIRTQIDQGQYLLDLAHGIPRPDAMRILYQHMPLPSDIASDPVKNGIGLIWYPPIIPLKTEHVKNLVDMTHDILTKHGFPAAILFTTANDKCAIGAIPIIYKKPQDAEKAMRCYDELVKQGIAIGCPPYRLNVQAMQHLSSYAGTGYWKTVANIKAAIDQQHVLSPGRYEAIKRWL